MGVHRTGSVERPWGWLVTVAAFIIHILSYGFSWSSGVLNAIFLETFDDPVMDISWVGTLVCGNMLTSGALASVVINKYGCRPTALIGGCLMSSGMILSFFAPSVYYLYFSLGVVSGIGGGFSFLASTSAVTQYFDRRRSLALGITSAGLGFGQFLFPALIRWLYQMYDWSGVLLINGGICLNICVCSIIFRPLPIVKQPREKEETAKFALHCEIFRNPGYISMCLNNTLICFGLSIIFIHLPAYGETVGIDDNRSALLMSAMGLANVFGRISFGIIDHHLQTRTFFLYATAFILSGVIVLLIPVSNNYPLQVTLAAFFGFFSGCFGVLLAVILAELVGLRGFATAYGYILLFEGLGTLTGGPFAGFLYDVTQVYDASLYASGSCLILSACLVILPYLQTRKPKNVLQIEIAEEKMPMNG